MRLFECGAAQRRRADALVVIANSRAATIARYEKFLRAITPGAVSRAALLDKFDFAEWVEEQAQTLLDGGEAECPHCCTPLHEGACVGEEAEDEDASPECEACGDRRGQCSHSS